ncbi:chromate transporter [Breznakia pachnodae]|uniref:Chromate transporter n=1 Tax=Breznakia pachnodae TaxID=265178 RepID=A0ABU0DXK9_9FIRM|nr:chromate transporter [Breznakia pachnodae]MDQ0359280.1 chromate transporter [Breznakia pachnodae]
MILLDIFIAFFKIGILGFGGGYAMLTMILDESLKLGLTLHQFADLNALDMLIPGPVAINAATYVGYIVSGVAGATIATVAVCIPSFILVSLYHFVENKLKNNEKMQYFLMSVKSSAVGLIASAAFILALGVFFNISSLREIAELTFNSAAVFSIITFLVCAIAHIKFKINPIFLTVLAGVVGYAMYYVL